MARTSPKYGIVFTGIAELTRELAHDGAVWQRVQKAAVNGMIENTEDLLGRSMRDAPIDEGTLRASGSAIVFANGKPVSRQGGKANPNPFGMEAEELTQLVGRFGRPGGSASQETHRIVERKAAQPEGLGDAVIGEVGFNTPYALVQHERLDFHHPKGGKAKYLEDNLKQQAGRYQGNLETHLRGALA